MLGGFSETVTVLRASAKDWRGDGGYAESHDVSDVLIQVESTSTDRDMREDWKISGKFLMPIGADMVAGDRVVLPDKYGDDVIVAVKGKPFPWKLNSWEPGKAILFEGVSSNGVSWTPKPGDDDDG